MRINFKSGATAVVSRVPSPVADAVDKMYKHLQHVALPFKPWDNPRLKNDLKSALAQTALTVGIHVEVAKLTDQAYLNYLHECYENSFNGDPAWLDFHECIHAVENKNIRPCLTIDYRVKGGILTKPFSTEWYKLAQTTVPAGAVYTEWCELGKIPYNYYRDKEPNDLKRLCELSKPWINLHPKLCIALEPIDFLADRTLPGFNVWWQNYENDWCRHWGLDSHSLAQQFGVIVVGHVDPYNIDNLLLNGDTVSQVVLQ